MRFWGQLGGGGAGGAPSGSAGGDLSGTYPNPTIAANAITNAKVSASAAIAYSKLALTGAIVNADIGASAAIAKSKLASLDVVNADVNASAAIAGTKISPDFGSQNVVTTGAASFGSSPATTGDIRVPYGFVLRAMQNGGGGNKDVIAFETFAGTSVADSVRVGTDGSNLACLVVSPAEIRIRYNSAAVMTVNSSGATFTSTKLLIGDTTLNQAGTLLAGTVGAGAVDSGGTRLRGQGTTAASGAGGFVAIQGGRAGSGGIAGGVKLQANTDNSTITTVFEIGESVAGTKALAFFAGSLTAKQTVTGSRAVTEQALASLLTALAAYGLITNSTTV